MFKGVLYALSFAVLVMLHEVVSDISENQTILAKTFFVFFAFTFFVHLLKSSTFLYEQKIYLTMASMSAGLLRKYIFLYYVFILLLTLFNGESNSLLFYVNIPLLCAFLFVFEKLAQAQSDYDKHFSF